MDMEQYTKEDSTDREKTWQVRQLFSRIAHRYDLLNRLMTFGQDIRWRREAIRHLQLDAKGLVLDLGAGTGDVALLIQKEYPEVQVVVADLTPPMIYRGNKRTGGKKVFWVVADALHLPFPSLVFKGVISGYLLRNVPDVVRSLREQYCVLAQNRQVISLDTTPPQRNILYPFIRFYLRVVIPVLGRFLAGDKAAYTYLSDSTERFLSAEKLADKMREAGFQEIEYARCMLGTMVIHWGKKI